MMSSIFVQWLCSIAAVVGYICPLEYSALPFQVKVVDAETGVPLEGVIVDAQWRMESRDVHSLGWFTVTEAVTDDQGIANLPGWGPLRIPKQRGGYFSQGRLSPNEPTVNLYKQGYHFESEAPSWQSAYLDHPFWTGDLVRKVELERTVIPLKPFHGTDEQYVRQLVSGQTGTATAIRCLWRQTPRMTAALINEGKRFGKMGAVAGLITLKHIEEYDGEKYCGSKDLVRQYLK